MALLNQASLYISDRTLSAENSLREGSVVYVRILENLGDGNYEATFAGKRFPVFSQNNLNPGSGFRARIGISGSSVVLEPVDPGNDRQTASADLQQSQSVYKTGISFSSFSSILSENPQILERFFSALSLPSDLLSLKIAQFLKQYGLKLDSVAAGKIHRIASKFGEKGAEAAEKALLLYEKNGHVDEDEVEKLLALCLGESLGQKETDDLNDVLAKANRKSENSTYWLIIPYVMEIPSGENIQNNLVGSLCLFKEAGDGTVKKLTVRGKYASLDFMIKADFHYCAEALKKNLLNTGKNKGKISKLVLRYLVQKNEIPFSDRTSDSALIAALSAGQNPDAGFDIVVIHDESLAAETLLTDDVPLGTVRILQ